MNSRNKIALAMVILAWTVAAADPAADGLAALKQGDFRKAYNLFLREVEAAKARKDDKVTADLLFYLGLCQQENARHVGEGEMRAGLLAEAAMSYNQALGLNPKSSSILNNLAQVYISQGATDLARETLTKAIALGDADQAFHMENYADLLIAKGEWKEACRFYALASWTQPDNPAPLQKLVEACLENYPALLGSYLWEITERGQILQAQEVALSVLPRAEWSQAQKEELLSIVAVSLSKQTYDPRQFLESDTAKSLRKLSEDTAVGAGAREMIELHGADKLSPQHFEWWRRRIDLSRNPPRGKWPLQAFQDLIRSLGEYYKTREEPEAAEYYLRLAIDIHVLAADTSAFVSLADLYARAGRQDALRELIRSKEDLLFGEKARAYQAHRLNEIYALHRALGSIYSYLEQWGRSSEPTSAIFQLEHALEIAQQTQRTPEGKPIAVEPALVDRLATGYEKTDQEVKAFKLRLEVAEDFQKAGRNEAAATVFDPIRHTAPPEALRARYEAFKPKLEGSFDSTRIDQSAARRVRVSNNSQSVDDQRQGQRLSESEVSAIQKSVGDLIGKAQPRASRGRTIEVLPAKGVPKGVKEIDLDGGRGRVLLEKNASTVAVPFTVDPAAGQKEPSVRYIKP